MLTKIKRKKSCWYLGCNKTGECPGSTTVYPGGRSFQTQDRGVSGRQRKDSVVVLSRCGEGVFKQNQVTQEVGSKI